MLGDHRDDLLGQAREPCSTPQLVSFGCIWTAVAIYTADSYRAARRMRIGLIEPFGTDD